MVHETAFSMPAVARKSLAATLFERNTMLKTLKRKIALVAVAGLGFGLVSTVPVMAADAATTVTNINLLQTGSTLAVKNNAGASDDAAARAGVQTLKITEAAAVDTAYHIAVTTAACNAIDATMLAGMATLTAGTTVSAVDPVVDGIGTAAANGGTVNTYTAGKIVVITPAAASTAGNDMTHTITTSSLAAGTWNVCVDPNVASPFATGGFSIGTITVVAAGAPASVSWKQSTREISTTAIDYATTFTVKDSSGISTVLVGSESVVLDVAPQTGVSASQVDLEDFTITANEIVATTGTTYPAGIDGNATGGATAGGGASGTTVAGTTYTLFAQIVVNNAAVGAPASSTYTRVSNTAGLTGTISFFSDAAATTASTSITGTPAVATSNFYGQLKDSVGAVVVGATLTASLTTLTDAALVTTAVTQADGTTTARNFTPAAGGTGSYNLSVSTGATAITASLPATVTAYGATVATNAGIAVTAGNGNGIKTVTAGTTYTPSISTTSFNIVISGVDAGKTVKLDVSGSTAGLAAKVAGVTGVGYAVADSTGKVTTTATTTAPAAGNALIIAVDANGAGGADATVTLTYATAAGALTTTPATSTTSFVAVSSSQTINAVVADQFSNPVTGGTVTIVNNSVPAGVTAMTTAQKNVDSAGKADLTATIGATAGTYQFTITARDANGNTIGTASVVTYTATSDGAPGSVTLTAGGSEAALGSYDVWVSPDGTPASNAAATAYASTATAAQIVTATGGWVVMTVSVKNAAGTGVDNVTVSAKGSDGVYISNAVTQAAGNIADATKLSTLADTSGVTAGGGTATFQVVATKVGTNTVTFTVGSKTAVATFKAKTGIAATSIARKVTLNTTAAKLSGNAITQVTATVVDAWGNPAASVSLTGVITGAAGRFAGGSRSFTATTDAAGQVVFELASNPEEKGTGTLTVTGTEDTDAAPNTDNEVAEFASADQSVNLSTLTKTATSSATATIDVTAASAVASPAIDAVKADVKAVSDTVATLSKAVTTIQSSVTELTSSFSAQIKSLSSAIAKISRAIAALSKKIK